MLLPLLPVLVKLIVPAPKLMAALVEMLVPVLMVNEAGAVLDPSSVTKL